MLDTINAVYAFPAGAVLAVDIVPGSGSLSTLRLTSDGTPVLSLILEDQQLAELALADLDPTYPMDTGGDRSIAQWEEYDAAEIAAYDEQHERDWNEARAEILSILEDFDDDVEPLYGFDDFDADPFVPTFGEAF